jgi:hypothetical protein
MSTPDIKSESYFKQLQKVFSENPNTEQAKLFKLYYGKIYESVPGYNNPIQINNLFFDQQITSAFNYTVLSDLSEDELYTMGASIFISNYFLESNFPLYFLSKDFVKNATDADVDINILFRDLTLPFKSVFYVLPKNSFLNWFSLTYISEKDDYVLYGITREEQAITIFLRDALTAPNLDNKEVKKYDPFILFAIATLLFHKTGGFDQKIIPITPLPIIKNLMGKIVIGQRKKVSPNILNSPKISYRKKSDSENLNEPVEFEGYKQIPSHIRIIKNKKTGEIKIVSVSSSEVNPDKRREGVEFKKHKMTDNEIAQLIKARKEDIVSRMKSNGYSEDEINQFLKQKNLNESFFKKEMTFKEYYFLKESFK